MQPIVTELVKLIVETVNFIMTLTKWIGDVDVDKSRLADTQSA